MLSRESFGAIKINSSSGAISNQIRWRLFLLVFAPALLFYISLLSPTITGGGDCGELISTSYNLGISHPSGYVIWNLVARTFALLPFGEIAWRYNLFSSICGATSAGLLTLACFEILIQPQFTKNDQKQSAFWAALSCGFLFGGFYFAASQFIIAEVYSLAALWGALLLWLGTRWHFGKDWRDALTLAFCAGIALIIHLSSIFILPWLFIFSVRGKSFPRQKIATLSALFVLGWVCVSYLPIRSSQFPALPQKNIDAYAFYPLDWSHPATLSQLKAHVTAAQYRGLLIKEYETVENGKTVTKKRLAQPISEVPKRLKELLLFIPMQFLWATPLVILGAFKSFKIRSVGWLLLLILVGNIGTQINYKVGDQTNFFFPAYLTMGIWMGIGWLSIFNYAFQRSALIAKAAPMLLLATVLSQWSVLALTLYAGGRTIHRDICLAEAGAAQKFAESTQKTAFVFFGSDDAMWRFWYTKYVLKKAPNVITPWGRSHYANRENGLWVKDVTKLKKSGPVFMTEWDTKTDQRYPYVAVENTGSIWLASERKLPVAATITNQNSPNTDILSAKIRRDPLWTVSSSTDANALAGVLMAFDIEFSLPENWKMDSKSVDNSFLGGEIELKVGKKGDIQKRRLILPTAWKAGQVLKVTVPLNIDIKTGAGRYGIWARLSNAPFAATKTEWKNTDFVQIVR